MLFIVKIKNEKNKAVLKMDVLDIYNNTLQKETKDKQLNKTKLLNLKS